MRESFLECQKTISLILAIADITKANECFKHWLDKPEEQESGSDQEETIMISWRRQH
jgi:hypothetical protein